MKKTIKLLCSQSLYSVFLKMSIMLVFALNSVLLVKGQSMSIEQAVSYIGKAKEEAIRKLKIDGYYFTGSELEFLNFSKRNPLYTSELSLGINANRVSVIGWSEHVGYAKEMRGQVMLMSFVNNLKASGYNMLAFTNDEKGMVLTLIDRSDWKGDIYITIGRKAVTASRKEVIQLNSKMNSTPRAIMIPAARKDSAKIDYSELRAVKSSTELLNIYGTQNIKKQGNVDFEGNVIGHEYILYPNSANEVSVSFDENGTKRLTFKKSNSNWKLPNGLYVHIPLIDVVKANGKDFSIYGFEWDYAGGLQSWKGGNLDGRGISVLFTAPENVNQSLYTKFTGDGYFSTSNPDLRKLNLYVSEITVRL